MYSSTREVRGRIVRWETCPSVLVGGLYAAYFVSNFPGAANIVFRVDPYAGDADPEKKSLQLCRGSDQPPAGQHIPS